MPVQQRLIESLLTQLPATQITGASTVTAGHALRCRRSRESATVEPGQERNAGQVTSEVSDAGLDEAYLVAADADAPEPQAGEAVAVDLVAEGLRASGEAQRDHPRGSTQRIKDGAVSEQVAAELGVSRSTPYRELRKYREDMSAKPVIRES
ncbi:hypothetical protein AB0C40_34500 [Streptomyces brevispora]|uniref:hypothetical protein n=1 Tax=Streptomyces brevispora TaxID=887462 RepID=UPI0033E69365